MNMHASHFTDGMRSDGRCFHARPLRLEEYFSGPTRAWGIFLDRFGTLRRQLEADIRPTWDGRVLVLDERFRYDDGETDRRIWRIEKIGEQRYRGQTDDMIGVAEGAVDGNSLCWSYGFRLPIGNRTLAVRFNDRYVFQGDDILLYRADLSKFGVTIGELTMVFRKP